MKFSQKRLQEELNCETNSFDLEFYYEMVLTVHVPLTSEFVNNICPPFHSLTGGLFAKGAW